MARTTSRPCRPRAILAAALLVAAALAGCGATESGDDASAGNASSSHCERALEALDAVAAGTGQQDQYPTGQAPSEILESAYGKCD